MNARGLVLAAVVLLALVVAAAVVVLGIDRLDRSHVTRIMAADSVAAGVTR
jgi:hypothetical protein